MNGGKTIRVSLYLHADEDAEGLWREMLEDKSRDPRHRMTLETRGLVADVHPAEDEYTRPSRAPAADDAPAGRVIREITASDVRAGGRRYVTTVTVREVEG